MQKSTTFPSRFLALFLGFQRLVIIACLALAVTGQRVESSRGWVVASETAVAWKAEGWKSKQQKRVGQQQRAMWAVGKLYARQTWQGVGWRSGLLLLCWGEEGAVWLAALPWVLWLWQLLVVVRGSGQPGLRFARQAERLLLVGGIVQGLVDDLPGGMVRLREQMAGAAPSFLSVGLLGCVLCGSPESSVQLGTNCNERGEVRHYTATLCGHFELCVRSDDFFRRRLLILFLRLLEIPGERRGSRRTRTGRTPVVRQQALAAAYGPACPQG